MTDTSGQGKAERACQKQQKFVVAGAGNARSTRLPQLLRRSRPRPARGQPAARSWPKCTARAARYRREAAATPHRFPVQLHDQGLVPRRAEGEGVFRFEEGDTGCSRPQSSTTSSSARPTARSSRSARPGISNDRSLSRARQGVEPAGPGRRGARLPYAGDCPRDRDQALARATAVDRVSFRAEKGKFVGSSAPRGA